MHLILLNVGVNETKSTTMSKKEHNTACLIPQKHITQMIYSFMDIKMYVSLRSHWNHGEIKCYIGTLHSFTFAVKCFTSALRLKLHKSDAKTIENNDVLILIDGLSHAPEQDCYCYFLPRSNVFFLFHDLCSTGISYTGA